MSKHRKLRGPTKEQLLQAQLADFNRWRKQQRERPLTLEEFDLYLHGKGLPEAAKVKLRSSMPTYRVDPDRDLRRYPSVITAEKFDGGKGDNSEKIEISSKLPVAPAYNKGGYQLLLPSEIKTAGRKV